MSDRVTEYDRATFGSRLRGLVDMTSDLRVENDYGDIFFIYSTLTDQVFEVRVWEVGKNG